MCKRPPAAFSRSRRCEAAVDLLNEFGIDRINIDLMYGLPKQTADDVQAHSDARAFAAGRSVSPCSATRMCPGSARSRS